MAKKKEKKQKWTEKLYDIAPGTWKKLVIAALAVMLIPIVIDLVMPETEFNSSVAAPEDLIVIMDSADLLTEEEEKELYSHMLPVTAYGGAAFYTNDSHVSSAQDFAREKYRENFGRKSGTIFVIDMYNRYLYIFSDGRIYDTVTKAKAETITDNVYLYARSGDYLECAEKTFDQIAAILDGNKIPQPMKHISNALLAMALSLVAVFIVTNAKTRMKKEDELQVYSEMVQRKFTLGSPLRTQLIESRKSRHVESSSYSGGGSSGGYSSGGGGGGGSGGSSGGGGGHGF